MPNYMESGALSGDGMILHLSIARLMVARDAGTAAALKVGDRFVGAFNAADKAGWIGLDVYRDAFIAGYLTAQSAVPPVHGSR